MNIVPISGLSAPQLTQALAPGHAPGQEISARGLPFQSVFEDAMQSFREAEVQKEQDSINLALGEVDDLATLGINSLRAEASLRIMVEMRNKIMDAYNEIMRMNL